MTNTKPTEMQHVSKVKVLPEYVQAYLDDGWTIVGDAPDEWDATLPPGGYVCSVCKTPVESEPCQEHQPIAYGRIS